MPEMRSVFSSHVDALGYDEESAELHVRFKDGNSVVYHGVPPEVAGQVVTAPSIGEALHQAVRGRFRHRYTARRQR